MYSLWHDNIYLFLGRNRWFFNLIVVPRDAPRSHKTHMIYSNISRSIPNAIFAPQKKRSDAMFSHNANNKIFKTDLMTRKFVNHLSKRCFWSSRYPYFGSRIAISTNCIVHPCIVPWFDESPSSIRSAKSLFVSLPFLLVVWGGLI